MLRLTRLSYRRVMLENNNEKIQITINTLRKTDMEKTFEYEKATRMPDVILDLTDETKTIEELIAECEENRQKVMPWYKKIVKRIKRLF